jgi:hypothetical protein
MAPKGDITGAEQTYSGFIALMKWGTIASVALTALVILLIAS